MAISINEFCSLVDIITARHGKNVLVSAQNAEGYMHFSKDGEHLGYIDVKTGSLIWDRGEE